MTKETLPPSPTIVWFRQDLRLSDHPALTWACHQGPVVLLYILDRKSPGDWGIGGAGQWWLHHSLSSLKRSLDKLKIQLVLRQGHPQKILEEVVKATGAKAITWNRCYEPASNRRDAEIKKYFQEKGLTVSTFNGSLLFEPWDLATQKKEPYKVYKPFSKRCWALENLLRKPFNPPTIQSACNLHSDLLEDFGLLPSAPNWAEKFTFFWNPGEQGARQRLEEFLGDAASFYKEGRDLPGKDYTSRLSPHLHWGEISPQQIWFSIQARTHAYPDQMGSDKGAKFLNELLWREFSYHLLHHFPFLPEKPLNPKFKNFPWADEKSSEPLLRSWKKGLTGYPVIDAGMRQLWQVGWMHNRMRMIVASFLVKHLLLPWQIGEAWFWDTLVDADLANNAASWQWVAGCGADAAPYFRIFNPVLQGLKFDAYGEYVRQWVPEIAGLPTPWIHKPWEASPDVLKEAGIILGKTYPFPIVDLDKGRKRALAAFASLG